MLINFILFFFFDFFFNMILDINIMTDVITVTNNIIGAFNAH